MRHLALILGFLFLSAAMFALGGRGENAESRAILLTVGAASLLAALGVVASALASHRTSAHLRLDWYLPMLRRPKTGADSLPDYGIVLRMLRRWAPTGVLSNWETKQRGFLRWAVRKLGVSWAASPMRRVTQGVCLVAFLISFFYVCWPYTAKPAPEPTATPGFEFADVDQQTGAMRFAIPPRADVDWMKPDVDAYLSENAEPTGEDDVLEFTIVERNGSEVTLRTSDGNGEGLDVLLTSPGPWVFWESHPAAWPSHYAEDLAAKEVVDAELFLAIDPLVSLSTAIAARSWVWSLVSAGCILIVCVVIPRGFCGYICPLGTTIDLFDWAVGRRIQRFRAPADGWWVHIKYYLLGATLIASLFGVLISGFFSAIPVITRGLLFLAEPIQSGSLREWRLVPAMHMGHWVSIALFGVVLGLGFLRPRFWCKYVCPSGAVFSIGNLFRVSERKVESSCIHCNKCVEICPFDAIKPDFTTRTTDCTLCQSCAGVCPTHAIKFVERWNLVELKTTNDPPTGETGLGRRGFLSAAVGGAAAIAGGTAAAGAATIWGANLDDPDAPRPVRPPGSVPEQEFLQLCIRCGECFKACPNNVLQPQGFEQGLEGLWTPQVVADWAGCDSSCNACGQVCPTGAIRALPLEEKKAARMGLAIVNETTCLPFADREACDLCVQECNAAGYRAIEFIQVGTEVDDDGIPIEGTGRLAPVVLDELCVGCGLCQTRCYGVNVKSKGLLTESAIVIQAGDGKEDRMQEGSYIELRAAEASARKRESEGGGYFVPGENEPTGKDENPFGLP